MTKCHHDSNGPPLKAFQFVADPTRKWQQYARETVKALQHIVGESLQPPGCSRP